MSDDEQERTGDEQFEHDLGNTFGKLKEVFQQQDAVKAKLFKKMFTPEMSARALETAFDVAFASLAKFVWENTEDDHASQAAAFEALGEALRLAKEAKGDVTDRMPRANMFKELRGVKD